MFSVERFLTSKMAKNSNKVKRNTNKANNFKLLAENRYAKFQYAISETIEAGTVSYTHLTLPTSLAV